VTIFLPPAASFESVYLFFLHGGFFMIPLALCSIISVAVIIIRGLALRRDLVMPPVIEEKIEAIRPDDVAEGVERLALIVRGGHSPLAKITQTAIQHLRWPKSENVEAVQTRAHHQMVRLESGLFILEIIVGIAPLLGLLGAVSGLVTVFASFGADASGQDPHGIAKGISEALSTTIVGLAIAIPSLIAYSYFAKKVENMAADMQTIIADLLAKCYAPAEELRAAPIARPRERYSAAPEEYAPVAPQPADPAPTTEGGYQ
jgi:biopolymer transport protein ExbB